MERGDRIGQGGHRLPVASIVVDSPTNLTADFSLSGLSPPAMGMRPGGLHRPSFRLVHFPPNQPRPKGPLPAPKRARRLGLP